MGVNGEALQLQAVYYASIYKSREIMNYGYTCTVRMY